MYNLSVNSYYALQSTLVLEQSYQKYLQNYIFLLENYSSLKTMNTYFQNNGVLSYSVRPEAQV